jgi:sulfofructose kinase
LKAKFDILGFGAVAVDDLIYVDAYPPPDSKTKVLETERQCGGLTAMALMAASRLGSTCAYAGVLGDDELSQFSIRELRSAGVDLSLLRTKRGVRPGHSFIVIDSDRGTRNVFTHSSNATAIQAGWPKETAIRSARVLLVDHQRTPEMIRAATIAREAGVPVVADFERAPVHGFSELLALVDHLILSARFAQQITGEKRPAFMANALWIASRKVVAITHGDKGCWYLNGDSRGKARHQPAVRVKTVDTTGCGDVFHGAYASALARGKSVEECIRFASVTAGLKATRKGGRRSIPSRATVERFLKMHRTNL